MMQAEPGWITANFLKSFFLRIMCLTGQQLCLGCLGLILYQCLLLLFDMSNAVFILKLEPLRSQG